MNAVTEKLSDSEWQSQKNVPSLSECRVQAFTPGLRCHPTRHLLASGLQQQDGTSPADFTLGTAKVTFIYLFNSDVLIDMKDNSYWSILR